MCSSRREIFGTLLGHDATYPRQKVYDCELLEFQPFIRSADYSRKDRQRKQHGRKRLAQDISNAAQNKIIVTGLEDEVDIKTFTMSNSEKIYTGLIQFANKEVSNLILGSESMAGGMQSYVGSTKAHQDIFRDRIEVYRRYIENGDERADCPPSCGDGYIPCRVGIQVFQPHRHE